MNAQAKNWYVPGSVLNALWGNIMPRLAASVWTGELRWPPDTGCDQLDGGLRACRVDDDALPEFAKQLVRISFRRSADEDWSVTEKSYALAAEGRNRLTNAQKSTLVTTEYFYPGVASDSLTNRPLSENRMDLWVIEARGYDFVLSDRGLDVFIPPKPGANGDADAGVAVASNEEKAAAREDVLQYYKFRETGVPPIGLPRAPATAFHTPARSLDGSFITIPQLTAPTGAHQVPEGWMRSLAKKVDWWLSGSLYRGVMAAFPRIVASKWYEEVTWDRSSFTETDVEKTYAWRFNQPGGLKEMIEERVETVLPEDLNVFVPAVKARPDWVPADAKGWNERDIMITSEGLYFPDPGTAPEWDELAKAIETGVAGNPVFTDSGPCMK